MIKKRRISTLKKTNSPSAPTQEYIQTLVDLKQHVQEAQIKATFSANKELMCLYWSIGKIITEKQDINGWGTKLIEQLAEDLQNSFPGIGGFSRANIFRFKAFFSNYENLRISNSDYGMRKKL
jgi:DUF1016 N-terminal domain